MAHLALLVPAILLVLAASPTTAFCPSPPSERRAGFVVAPPVSSRTPSSGAATRSPSRRLSTAPGSGAGSCDYDDFAEFTSTQLASSAGGEAEESERQGGDEGGDLFLSSLQSRVREVEDRSNKLPLMILDTMLPRQILQIQIEHPTLKSLMKVRVGQETPTLGMLGMAKLSTGQTVPLKAGVEVEIIQMEKAMGAPPGTSGGDDEPWDVSLRAGRRFAIEGDVIKTEGGWTEAQVKFLDSQSEEEEEVRRRSRPSISTADLLGVSDGDRLSVARAISKCKAFTEPNANMEGAKSLVDRWVELARENERHPGQIDALLRQLGDIPPEHEPTERALWVGALINPLPSMGVATEIRPALLVSKSAEERVRVALDGLLRSIKHMDGSARMW